MASDPICFLKIGLMGVSAQRGHDILTKGRSPSKNNRKGERERETQICQLKGSTEVGSWKVLVLFLRPSHKSLQFPLVFPIPSFGLLTQFFFLLKGLGLRCFIQVRKFTALGLRQREEVACNLLNLWKVVLCVFHSYHRTVNHWKGMSAKKQLEQGLMKVIVRRMVLSGYSLHLLVLE